MLPALPTGSATTSGGAELIDDLEGAGLLARDAVGVHRVDHDDAPIVAERANGRQRLVEVALDHDQPCAGGKRLGQLAARHLAGRQDDVARQPGGRGVCSGRCGCVAGRCADDSLRPAGQGPVHGEHHAAVLERACRVRALDLQVQRVEPQLAAESRGMDQRRSPLPQGDREGLAGKGDEIAIPLEERRIRGHQLVSASRTIRACSSM